MALAYFALLLLTMSIKSNIQSFSYYSYYFAKICQVCKRLPLFFFIKPNINWKIEISILKLIFQSKISYNKIILYCNMSTFLMLNLVLEKKIFLLNAQKKNLWKMSFLLLQYFVSVNLYFNNLSQYYLFNLKTVTFICLLTQTLLPLDLHLLNTLFLT